jgi:hypothetical protein
MISFSGLFSQKLVNMFNLIPSRQGVIDFLVNECNLSVNKKCLTYYKTTANKEPQCDVFEKFSDFDGPEALTTIEYQVSVDNPTQEQIRTLRSKIIEKYRSLNELGLMVKCDNNRFLWTLAKRNPRYGFEIPEEAGINNLYFGDPQIFLSFSTPKIPTLTGFRYFLKQLGIETGNHIITKSFLEENGYINGVTFEIYLPLLYVSTNIGRLAFENSGMFDWEEVKVRAGLEHGVIGAFEYDIHAEKWRNIDYEIEPDCLEFTFKA